MKDNVVDEYYDHSLPFICANCGIFCSKQMTVFANSRLKDKVFCGYCVGNKIDDFSDVKRERIFQRFLLQFPHFHILLPYIIEIKSSQKLHKQHPFMCVVPINTKTINTFFCREYFVND